MAAERPRLQRCPGPPPGGGVVGLDDGGHAVGGVIDGRAGIPPDAFPRYRSLHRGALGDGVDNVALAGADGRIAVAGGRRSAGRAGAGGGGAPLFHHQATVHLLLHRLYDDEWRVSGGGLGLRLCAAVVGGIRTIQNGGLDHLDVPDTFPGQLDPGGAAAAADLPDAGGGGGDR